MTFFSGNTDMDTLVDLIADQLIATGAWVTADATLATGAHPARRAIKHATDAGFILTLERAVATQGISHATDDTVLAGINNRFNEVRATVSSSFDTVAHQPSGTIRLTGFPTEAWQISSPGYQYYDSTGTGSGNKTGQMWLWVAVEGFTVFSKWTASTRFDYTAFFSMERSTAKEYADGATNVVFTAFVNSDYPIYDGGSQSKYYARRYQYSTSYRDLGRYNALHPFLMDVRNEYNNNAQTLADVLLGLDLGVARFFGAYKSPGNSKIYFQFPWYSNREDTLQRSPIIQAQQWFWVERSQGLADGDLVNYVQGAQTLTYLMKESNSPDSTEAITLALRQA